MELFFKYLGTRKKTIAAFFFFMVLFTVSVTLFRLPVEVALYPTALCAIFGSAFLIIGFIRSKRVCETLEHMVNQSCEAIDKFPVPVTCEEEKYIDLCRSLCAQNEEIRARDSSRYNDMVEYYTVWAHQIKTPIAAMKLTLQNEDSSVSHRLEAELMRIEQYADMVMAFLRLESDLSDYVFRNVELDDILRPSVRKFAFEFIDRHLRLDYEPVKMRLVTDEKWLAFVIEQLLSNALKYTREGGIKIFIKEPAILCVEDTGIGISKSDLPRVFERGYTGYNGRMDRSASGIGLYLCGRVCEKLGIGISIESEPDRGTCVLLDLVQHKMRTE